MRPCALALACAAMTIPAITIFFLLPSFVTVSDLNFQGCTIAPDAAISGGDRQGPERGMVAAKVRGISEALVFYGPVGIRNMFC